MIATVATPLTIPIVFLFLEIHSRIPGYLPFIPLLIPELFETLVPSTFVLPAANTEGFIEEPSVKTDNDAAKAP